MQPVFVILDAANLRLSVAAALGKRGFADIRLSKLFALLRGRGLEPVGCAVAMPTQFVLRSPRPAGETTRDREVLMAKKQALIDDLKRWFGRESSQHFDNAHRGEKKFQFRTIELLPGGHSDDGEVGVDDLIVAKTVTTASEIERDPKRSGQKILVLSHDTDLLHLAQFTGQVEVIVMGHGRALRDSHDCGEITLMGLSADELKFLADDKSTPQATSTFKRERSNIVNPPNIVDSNVAVVVDAYGLACGAAAALGYSEFPSANSVRQCLVDMGLASSAMEVGSLTFVVPDIHTGVTPRRGHQGLADAERVAWDYRDRQLDTLHLDLTTDDDAGTEAVRGGVTPVHIPVNVRQVRDRSHLLRYIKRYSTLLIAVTLRKILYSPAKQVVVFTDNPDVILALDYILTKTPELLRGKQLLRVGLLAEPLLVPASRASLKLPYLVLTAGRLAKLVRIVGPVGRDLRSILEDGSSEVATGEWEVIGFEPEVRGLRVRSQGDPNIQAVLVGPQFATTIVGSTVSGADASLHVELTPYRPTDLPMLTTENTEVEFRIAKVLGRDADSVSIDWDEDGIEDSRVPLGHDLEAVEPGSTIVVGKSGKAPLCYIFFKELIPSKRSQVDGETVAIVSGTSQEDGLISATLDGRTVRAHPIQGASLSGLRPGDKVVVLDIGSGDEPHYVVMSSAVGEIELFEKMKDVSERERAT